MPRILASLLLFFTVCLSSVSYAQKDITLNLQNADLRVFIETVSKITGKNFVIDPNVQGAVTLISPETLDKDSLYDVFLTVLEVHGFSAIEGNGGVVKIVPSNKAQTHFMGLDGVTQVFSLSHIKAEQILPTLKPLMPNGSFINADAQNNLLIISGSPADVGRVASIIERVDQTSGSDFDVIRLHNASAINIAASVTTLLGAQDTSQNLKIVADERTNSVLLRAPEAEKLRIRALITHLDTPIENAGNTEVIYLRNGNAVSIAEVLNDAKGAIIQQADNSEAETINLTNASSTNNSSVDIRADENTNSLIITAPPATLKNLKQVVAKLDIRRSQVLVEAIIAEMSMSDIESLGVQWYANAGSGTPIGVLNFDGPSSIFSLAAGIASYNENGTVPDGFDAPSGMLIGGGTDHFGVLINALENNTDSNILSTPSLVVLDNEEANIMVGENIPYLTGSYTTNSDTSSNPFQTIEREDVGVKLEVKPQINEGDLITLDIYQEVSNVVESEYEKEQGPTTAKRALKTNVLVENNQILVLGGLIDNQYSKTEQKIPLLGDIPLIGGLFRSNSNTGRERNLMVFLRPRILRDRSSATLVTEEKYNFIRNAQLTHSLGNGKNVLPNLESNEEQAPAPVFERSRPYSP